MDTEAERGTDLAEVFAAHRLTLIGYARRICVDLAAAEDIVQQAYIRLHEASRLRQVVDPPNYLYSIVRNMALDDRGGDSVRRGSSWPVRFRSLSNGLARDRGVSRGARSRSFPYRWLSAYIWRGVKAPLRRHLRRRVRVTQICAGCCAAICSSGQAISPT